VLTRSIVTKKGLNSLGRKGRGERAAPGIVKERKREKEIRIALTERLFPSVSRGRVKFQPLEEEACRLETERKKSGPAVFFWACPFQHGRKNLWFRPGGKGKKKGMRN